MSGSYNNRKDVIQISLGPTSNAIVAHTLNLQGLAATASDNLCDPLVTHSVEHQKWVPRALFVDEPTKFAILPDMTTAESLAASFQQQQMSTLSAYGGSNYNTIPWTGTVEPLDMSLGLQHDPFQFPQVMNSASILANSSHSRYYAPAAETITYKASASNPRHVIWDDEEEEEEEEEDEYERASRLQRQQNQWRQNTEAPLQAQLNQWGASTTADTTTAESSYNQNATTTTSMNWMDILMPPYSQTSKMPLPYSKQSQMHSHWDSYYSVISNNSNSILHEWKENGLNERVRHILEASDTVQGVCLTTEGSGLYAGLATHLLQEFQDECKSAARLVFHVTNPEDGVATSTTTTTTNDNGGHPAADAPSDATDSSSSSSWQPFHVNRLRTNLSCGLAMSDFCENAHATLPLRLDGGKSTSLFEQTAKLAMALESATLPFRMNGKSNIHTNNDGSTERSRERYTIGLQNAPFFGQGGGDSRWGTTAKSLSMWEYLACLQPQHNYSILELDVLGRKDSEVLDGANPNGGENTSLPFSSLELWERFRVGTSVERDHRMRSGGRDAQRSRPRDSAPGEWLQDRKDGGVLTSLSLENPTKRSLHTHFSLNTLVRPILPTNNDPSSNYQYPYSSPMSQYLTCIVEGMGISYRPERSMSLILDQTLHQLTRDGYGAGSYWKSFVAPETPVVAVVGNTTRVYPYLNQVSLNMKTVTGHRYRGLYNRDLMNGVLPELEDCSMALENCYNIADTYRPPSGSGLVDDDGDIDW